MKLLSTMTVCAVAVAMVGCATRPENVIPHYVSTGKYDSYDCKRLVREADEVNVRVRQLTGSLSTKADTDAALVTVGLILFWPALLALPATGGKPEEMELGRLKGDAEAIQRAYKEKDCGNTAAPTTPTPIVAPAVAEAAPAPSSNSTATPSSTPVLTVGRGQSSSFIDLRSVSCRLVDGTVETLPRTTCTDRGGTVIQSK